MAAQTHAPLATADRISTISVSSTMKVAADADRLRREGVDVVDFGAGEPDFPTPDNIKQAAVKALDANFTKYTPAGGTQELKEAVCFRHKQDFGTDYKPAECLITVGGKHAIFNLMQALINPGDEVVIPVPYWVTYKDVVNYAGGKCVFIDTDENTGFEVTAAMIEPHITSRTKLIIINSPCNPSGGVIPREEFVKIFELAKNRGVFLMTDECYCQFLYDDAPFSIAALPGAKDTVLVAGSLSKTYAMTGWRIGFALAPTPIIGAMMKLQSHSTSNPTSIAQKAAVEAMRGPQDSVPVMLAEYRRRRDFVIERLRQIPGVSIVMPKGAFYAYPNISVAYKSGRIKNSLDFAEQLLAKSHVAVVPGEAFGTSDHIRISYATSMVELTRGLDRLQSFIKEASA
ncbi:MAG TPA: pyridoxal phosphate-dependent aminotransferase [Bryobacteraceae bacterium]|nr:pyridoxal phosphate-dependent aminotransferase [Bryobacteraceae bacterium]